MVSQQRSVANTRHRSYPTEIPQPRLHVLLASTQGESSTSQKHLKSRTFGGIVRWCVSLCANYGYFCHVCPWEDVKTKFNETLPY